MVDEDGDGVNEVPVRATAVTEVADDSPLFPPVLGVPAVAQPVRDPDGLVALLDVGVGAGGLGGADGGERLLDAFERVRSAGTTGSGCRGSRSSISRSRPAFSSSMLALRSLMFQPVGSAG